MRVEGLGKIGCIYNRTIGRERQVEEAGGRRSTVRGVSRQVAADKGCRDASRRVISKHLTYANP